MKNLMFEVLSEMPTKGNVTREEIVELWHQFERRGYGCIQSCDNITLSGAEAIVIALIARDSNHQIQRHISTEVEMTKLVEIGERIAQRINTLSQPNSLAQTLMSCIDEAQ
jgi:hypothetical protein